MFITENASKGSIKNKLLDFIESGFVSYDVDPHPHGQVRLYNQCNKKHREAFNWLAFFDADEILVIRRCSHVQ